MKRFLAKTLTSTALVVVTFTAAQADNQSPFPSPTASDENPRLYSPALLQSWAKRDAIIAKEAEEEAKRRTRIPLRPAFLPYQQPLMMPGMLQYWEQREAALAQELKNAPPSGRFDYVPRSNVRQ